MGVSAGQFMAVIKMRDKSKKKVILSEFCPNTGYNRKYAIRLLNGPQPEKERKPPRRRGVSYSQETTC